MNERDDHSTARLVEIGKFISSQRKKSRAGDYDVVTSRPNRRLTQAHAAELLGIAEVTYQKIEQGTYKSLNMDLLRTILTLFRVTPFQQEIVLTHQAPSLTSAAADTDELIEPHAVKLVQECAEMPMLLLNVAQDILAWNRKAVGLITDFSPIPKEDRNLLLIAMLHPLGRQLIVDWDRDIDSLVTELRINYIRHPLYALRIEEIVGRLTAHSDDFVRFWRGGFGDTAGQFTRTFDHPVVGKLNVYVSFMELIASNGMVVVAFSAQDEGTRVKFSQLGSR